VHRKFLNVLRQENLSWGARLQIMFHGSTINSIEKRGLKSRKLVVVSEESAVEVYRTSCQF